MPSTDERGDRITADVDVSDAVRAVVVPVADRLGQPHYLKGKHFAAVMLDMIALRANGANEAELSAYGLQLLDLAHTLCSARPVDEKEAARMLLEADVAEDRMRGIVAIEGESPSLLDEHAALLHKQAATSLVFARVRQRNARKIRTNRQVARARFNLNGAA